MKISEVYILDYDSLDHLLKMQHQIDLFISNYSIHYMFDSK